MSLFKKLALAATLGVACLGTAQAAEEDTNFLLVNTFAETTNTTAQYFTISNLGLDTNGAVTPRLAGDTFVDDYYLQVFDSQTFSLFVDVLSSAVTFSNITMYDLFGDIYPFTASSITDTSFLGTGLTLDSGLYALEVTGTINADGGSYSGALSNIPAAVPEPEQWALLLAGLGVLGLVGRRRANRGR